LDNPAFCDGRHIDGGPNRLRCPQIGNGPETDRKPACPPDQGEVMAISTEMTNLAACAFVSAVILYGYIGVCLAYAVDCY
jgi:hypothetical protein